VLFRAFTVVKMFSISQFVMETYYENAILEMARDPVELENC
jgi:hypothetical protein